MKCYSCGNDRPESGACPYCGAQPRTNDRVSIESVVYVRGRSSDPGNDPYQRMRSQAEKEGTKALILSILSLVFGVIVLRTALAVIALVISSSAIKQTTVLGFEPPTSLTAARVIAIISLCLAGAAALFLLGWFLTVMLPLLRL